jgi:hypothetical protein
MNDFRPWLAQVVELRFCGRLSVGERRSARRFTTECDERLEAGTRVAGKRASLWSLSGRSVTSRKLWDAVVVIDIKGRGYGGPPPGVLPSTMVLASAVTAQFVAAMEIR